jgi:hypothetical protein
VGRFMHGHVLEQAGVDGALHPFEVGLGNLQQAQATGAFGLQCVAVVVRAQGCFGAQPQQAVQWQVQPLGQFADGWQIG